MKKILFRVSLLIILLTAGLLAFIFHSSNSYAIRIKTKATCYITLKFDKQEHSPIITKNTLIKIDSGTTVQQIASILVKKGIVKQDDQKYFTCLLAKDEIAPNIKAGYFILKQDQLKTLNQLAKKLTNPENAVLNITIPDGLRYDQELYLLQKNLNNEFSKFKSTEFTKLVKQPSLFRKQYSFIPTNAKTLEGFLFPDTYQVNIFETTAKDIIIKMLDAFEKKALPVLNSKDCKTTDLSMYQRLILASILERETNPQLYERQVVADILLKRLRSNMHLQVDTALLYEKKDWSYELTYQDLHTDHEYNTYTRIGLPVGPISNPSLLSMKATCSPIKNDYWYFLHDKQGKIHYSKTYQEHLIYVDKYLR